MKILILQPKLEPAIQQLEQELNRRPEVDAVLFPEGYLNENVPQARALAAKHGVALIGGHRNFQERPKDRAIIIDGRGEVVLDRVKYSETSFAAVNGFKIGHILCDELVVQGLKCDEPRDIDILVHPIGVGMFSDEQFAEWIGEARKLAATHKTMIIGTSHADGSFRDADVSIPIAYCIDREGKDVFIAKNDTRPRILNLITREVSIASTTA